jgi:hypothetical protein
VLVGIVHTPLLTGGKSLKLGRFVQNIVFQFNLEMQLDVGIPRRP